MQPSELAEKPSEIERILKLWVYVPMAITGLIVFGVLAPMAFLIFGADSGPGSFIIEYVPMGIMAVMFANMGGMATVFYFYRRLLPHRQLHRDDPDYNRYYNSSPISMGKYMTAGSIGGIIVWALISTGVHYTIKLMTG